MQPNDSVCAYAWSHMRLMHDLTASPCCNFVANGTKIRDGQALQKTLEEPYFEEMRQKMLRNEPIEGCRKCIERETKTGYSMRMVANGNAPGVWNEAPKLRSVEFFVGNHCNLKCRGCSSKSSTKWAQDEAALGMSPKGIHKPRRSPLSQLDGSWEELGLVKFVGGEPLMWPDHEEFIARLAATGRLGEVTLDYSTNGTFRVSQSVIESWRKLKHLHICFSIDGLKERNDYFRAGSAWREVVSNMHWFNEQLHGMDYMMGIHTVVNIYNVHEILELDLWLNNEFPGVELNKDCLTRPRWLDVRNLPEGEKTKLAESFDRASVDPRFLDFTRVGYSYIRDFLKMPYQADLREFRDREGKLDEVRGVDLRDYNPGLADLVLRETVS